MFKSKFLLFIILLISINTEASVNPGEKIESSLINQILTRLGVIEEKHPMGYHVDNGCSNGFIFIKTNANGLGLCSKLFDASSSGKTSFGNMLNCTDSGGKVLGFFEIQSMLTYDLNKFKTMASHTTGWKSYADGFRTPGEKSSHSETGFYGVLINVDQVCTTSSAGTCYTGDMNWDHADKTTDVETTGRVIC